MDSLERALRAVYETAQSTNEAAERELEALGLTFPTAQALWAIDPDAQPQAMKELATKLHCNASNLTFVSDRLVDRGFVERRESEHDRRSRVLTLTAEGKRVRKLAIAALKRASPLAGCSSTELKAIAKSLSAQSV